MRRILSKPFYIGLGVLLIAVLAGMLKFFSGPESVNNFLIFKYSFFNLKDSTNLYSLHPAQHFDLYKYSPTFAAMMFPFFYLPEWFSYFLWTLLNCGLLAWGVYKLPLDAKKKSIFFFIILFELLTATQNSQSNALVAGLILLAFLSFEKENLFIAAMAIALTFYIKVFGIALAALFLLYPKKLKFILSLSFCMLLLGILPLLFTDILNLKWQYLNWIELLRNDPAHELNYSLMTFAERSLGIYIKDLFYLVPGLFLLLLPLVRKSQYSSMEFRMMLVASFLIWFVIFNHKAESPSYIIALTGSALWFSASKPSAINISLIIFVVVLTSLSATDLFPRVVRDEFIRPYALKALPCIVLWMVCGGTLIGNRFPDPEKKH